MIVIPVDHGLAKGPIPGLADLPNLVKSLAGSGADAVLMNRGAAAACAESLAEATDLGLIVHLSAGSELSDRAQRRRVVCSVEGALGVGADAVSVNLNLGCSDDVAQLAELAEVQSCCARLGVPLLAMMYVVRDKPTCEEVAHAARMAWELGVDLIKIPYPGKPEGLRHVVDSVPCPVLCAGGAVGAGAGILDLARVVVESGAAGLAAGRHVFQHPDPALIAGRLADVLHGTNRIRPISLQREPQRLAGQRTAVRS